jgi:Protein of unknown function (DUF2867)
MEVVQCTMPHECAFSRNRDTYYYWDSFETSLGQPNLSAQKIYLGIFSHYPRWGKWLLLLRNKIVSVLGVKGPTSAEIDGLKENQNYSVGDKIGLFTLFSQSADELIAGGDDKHLAFKVSVLKVAESGATKVVLTTIVSPHNFFGRLYLFVILPFHKIFVKTLMRNAVVAGRI